MLRKHQNNKVVNYQNAYANYETGDSIFNINMQLVKDKEMNTDW